MNQWGAFSCSHLCILFFSPSSSMPRFTHSPVSVQARLGQRAELRARFAGLPPPVCRWFKGDKELEDGMIRVRQKTILRCRWNCHIRNNWFVYPLDRLPWERSRGWIPLHGQKFTRGRFGDCDDSSRRFVIICCLYLSYSAIVYVFIVNSFLFKLFSTCVQRLLMVRWVICFMFFG